MTESAMSPLRGVVELDHRTPEFVQVFGISFALEIPRVRFHTKSIHYIAGLDDPRFVSDEAAASRRALYSCPDAVYRLDAFHTLVPFTHPWDIARHVRSLLC